MPTTTTRPSLSLPVSISQSMNLYSVFLFFFFKESPDNYFNQFFIYLLAVSLGT